MIVYAHYIDTTYAYFVGETDNLRYDWFHSLYIEFKKKLPFMENAILYKFIKKYTPTDKVYMGKSKCQYGDKYDKKTGEEIARNRLLEKYYYDVTRIQDDIKQYLEDKIETNLRKEYNYMIEREGNIIYEIVGNTVTARYAEPWGSMLYREIITSFKDSRIVFPSVFDFVSCHCYKECGIAKCSPNDKFDKKFGKKLARERLVTKYNRMRFRYFKQVGCNIYKSYRIILNKRLKYYEASRYKKEG